ncbi:hypothetical protein B0H21DRAFT_360085 [Amylocystis lapponica]|nr:hypothetical protein B0H21DRAFT_360085 [Amylocystis lapponica]
MTRTARAVFPRAILKDRTESRSGMDKRTPKNGAGTHNWGALVDERELEDAADFDEESGYDVQPDVRRAQPPLPHARTRSLTEEDIQTARDFRKRALKLEGVDLSAIARTSSAVSTSPVARPSPISASSDAETASNRSF